VIGTMEDSKQNDPQHKPPTLNKRSLNELDDVIQEIMERNLWFVKSIEDIVDKQTKKKV
jgi:hypothetical protein